MGIILNIFLLCYRNRWVGGCQCRVLEGVGFKEARVAGFAVGRSRDRRKSLGSELSESLQEDSFSLVHDLLVELQIFFFSFQSALQRRLQGSVLIFLYLQSENSTWVNLSSIWLWKFIFFLTPKVWKTSENIDYTTGRVGEWSCSHKNGWTAAI